MSKRVSQLQQTAAIEQSEKQNYSAHLGMQEVGHNPINIPLFRAISLGSTTFLIMAQ